MPNTLNYKEYYYYGSGDQDFALHRVFSGTYMRRDLMNPYKKNPNVVQWMGSPLYSIVIIYDNSTEKSVDTEHIFCAYNGDGGSDSLSIDNTNCISSKKLKNVSIYDTYKAAGGLGCRKSSKSSCFLCDKSQLNKNDQMVYFPSACDSYKNAFKDKSRFKKYREQEDIDPFNDVIVKSWTYNPI